MNSLWLVNMDIGYSTRNRQEYYTLELFDEETVTMVRTYVSPDNENYAYWHKVITQFRLYPDVALCLGGKFRTKRGHTDVVNADAKPHVIASHDLEDLLHAIHDLYLA